MGASPKGLYESFLLKGRRLASDRNAGSRWIPDLESELLVERFDAAMARQDFCLIEYFTCEYGGSDSFET